MEQIQICLCNFRAKLEINLDILVFFSTHGCLQFPWNRMYFYGAILRLRDHPLIVLCHGFYSLIKSWWHTSFNVDVTKNHVQQISDSAHRYFLRLHNDCRNTFTYANDGDCFSAFFITLKRHIHMDWKFQGT